MTVSEWIHTKVTSPTVRASSSSVPSVSSVRDKPDLTNSIPMRALGWIRKTLEVFDARAGVENDGDFIRSDPSRTRELTRCGATSAAFRSNKQAFGGPDIPDRLDHLGVGNRESYSVRF